MKIKELTGSKLSILDFELLVVGGGEESVWQSDNYEAAFVIIEGECSLSLPGLEEVKFSRKNVFDDLPSAVFVPPKTQVSITAKFASTIAVCKALSEQHNKPVLVSQDMIREEWRGKEGYRRKIRNIINTETKTHRLALGETMNLPWNWSSFPPHKHDEYIPGKEVPLEEIYFFRVRPDSGFGIQRVYSANGERDRCYTVRDRDCIFIPKDYHPVANIPGHELYYLWMLAGNERTYIWNVDPRYKWLE